MAGYYDFQITCTARNGGRSDNNRVAFCYCVYNDRGYASKSGARNDRDIRWHCYISMS